MPSRNIIKEDVATSYYHIYSRGASKLPIYCDDNDYGYFLHLFERYLSINSLKNINGSPYPYYGDKIQLVCFCLKQNHLHLLVFQINEGAMSAFMRSLLTSYSSYFNKKYKRTGSLFESRYKASRINKQSYLEHISRYIHLNPRYWKKYRYSSIGYYNDKSHPDWIHPKKILEQFKSAKEYITFVEDYEEHKQMLDEIKHELANE